MHCRSSLECWCSGEFSEQKRPDFRWVIVLIVFDPELPECFWDFRRIPYFDHLTPSFPPASNHGLWLVTQIRMTWSRPNPLGWCVEDVEVRWSGYVFDGMTPLYPLKRALLLCNLMISYAHLYHLFLKRWHRVLGTQPPVADVKRFLCRALAFVCVCLVVYGSFGLWNNAGGYKKFTIHFTGKLSKKHILQFRETPSWSATLWCPPPM